MRCPTCKKNITNENGGWCIDEDLTDLIKGLLVIQCQDCLDMFELNLNLNHLIKL